MLGPIGMQELIIIFVIALLVFGPRKLPQLGKSLGRSIGEFKRASNELRNTLEEEIRVEETRKEIMEPIESIGQEARAAVKESDAGSRTDGGEGSTKEASPSESNGAEDDSSKLETAPASAAASASPSEPTEAKKA